VSMLILWGCSPPQRAPDEKSELEDVEVVATPDTSVAIVEDLPVVDLKTTEDWPSAFEGRWIIVNLGHPASSAFMEEVESGLAQQVLLSEAGIPVIHAVLSDETSQDLVSLPPQWENDLPERRTIPVRLLIHPDGHVAKTWNGHVSVVAMLEEIRALSGTP